MPFLIDGHNLIGSMKGIELSDPEDESRLMAILRRFLSSSGSQATVYFDRGSLLSRNPPTSAGLTVHFTRPPSSADDAIRGHLRRLGGEAKNWTVVSSDREVRAAANRAGARSLSSAEFARQLLEPPAASSKVPPEKPQGLSPEEVQEWLKLFQSDGNREH